MADYGKPVVFKLGDLSYGIDIRKVKSIEVQVNIQSVPNVAPFIKGIINLREEVIPVYDIKQKFNLSDLTTTGAAALIVEVHGKEIAFPVDVVEEIREISDSEIREMPAIIKKEGVEYLDRVANMDGKLIVLLDVEQMITKEEIGKYNEFTEEYSKED